MLKHSAAWDAAGSEVEDMPEDSRGAHTQVEVGRTQVEVGRKHRRLAVVDSSLLHRLPGTGSVLEAGSAADMGHNTDHIPAGAGGADSDSPGRRTS